MKAELEKVSNEYANGKSDQLLAEAFRNGANWMRKQMMEDSVEGRVIELDTGYYQLIVPALSTIIGNMEDYEKVKVLIIKEDEK